MAIRSGIYGAGIAGFAALFALAMIPAESGNNGFAMYGMAELVHTNAAGDILSSQSVHNQIPDVGEDFLITSIFNTAIADPDVTIDTICITGLNDNVINEDFSSYSAPNDYRAPGITASENTPCLRYDAPTYTAGDGILTVGPLEYVGDTNLAAGQSINSIIVCHEGNNNLAHCNAGPDRIFAITDVTNTVVNDGDVVSITYTFNVVSDDA
ncbi:hypothetical protein CENSYa_0762 [Cenarchaeum symbiosum A]|uniref:Uncharacterized protein n=1 Tax=Cenarchaeum symbiosum (strain A) TaxID=414004 RepID=A0RVM8_CENSY|nr:hypothetical protein CENSYa_0762 [Cenarchaeum symbiosum A]